ncbi:hypothetical protein [Xanthomonas sp. MUS 060]|uniref:hypothetical protein n=1 Tax=Xanthomonas sp. MUS 060 TaxID=1588031 RepID=UPI000695E937|nr:hypothetical protein [Xanthomonas sp. MUS 060]
MRASRRFTVFLALLLTLSACQRMTTSPQGRPAGSAATTAPAATAVERQSDVLPVQWRCGEELVPAALDATGERLALRVRGIRLDLHRAGTGTEPGARYADALGNTFWQPLPDQATLTLSGQGETLKCVRQGSGAIG